MTKVIGTCSNCGGRVTVPEIWHGINPPVPQCESCLATAKAPGPTIPMNPPPVRGHSHDRVSPYDLNYAPGWARTTTAKK